MNLLDTSRHPVGTLQRHAIDAHNAVQALPSETPEEAAAYLENYAKYDAGCDPETGDGWLTAAPLIPILREHGVPSRVELQEMIDPENGGYDALKTKYPQLTAELNRQYNSPTSIDEAVRWMDPDNSHRLAQGDGWWFDCDRVRLALALGRLAVIPTYDELEAAMDHAPDLEAVLAALGSPAP